MILRKDYVKLIQEGKVQVQADKTEEHNEMLNIIFPERRGWGFSKEDMGLYFKQVNNGSTYISDDKEHYDLPIIHANDIILNNAVVKVESIEHGYKVIEWWKEQGATNKQEYFGNSIGNYYGVNNGDIYFIYSGAISDKKIITLPELFPEKESKQENNMKIITPEQAQEIIDMVNISCQWKGKLLDLWAKTIVLREQITVSDELLSQGRKEASQGQKEVLDRIFGKELGPINLWRKSNISNFTLFFDDLDTEDTNLISLHTGEKDCFKLSESFNWELNGNKLKVSHK